MEIIQERLYREFNMDVITTVPNVSYKVHTSKGEVIDVHNPSGLPEPTLISSIEEPYILAQIITKAEFLGSVIKLCIDKRERCSTRFSSRRIVSRSISTCRWPKSCSIFTIS